MTDRESDAIRELMNILRSDITVVSKVLSSMLERGYTAHETQQAVNAIAERTEVMG